MPGVLTQKSKEESAVIKDLRSVGIAMQNLESELKAMTARATIAETRNMDLQSENESLRSYVQKSMVIISEISENHRSVKELNIQQTAAMRQNLEDIHAIHLCCESEMHRLLAESLQNIMLEKQNHEITKTALVETQANLAAYKGFFKRLQDKNEKELADAQEKLVALDGKLKNLENNSYESRLKIGFSYLFKHIGCGMHNDASNNKNKFGNTM